MFKTQKVCLFDKMLLWRETSTGLAIYAA